MSKVKRFHTLKIDASQTKLEENGWLRTKGYLSRTGVFDYRGPTGGLYKEYRPEAEVFSTDSMASFELVPLTDDHPDVALDAENTKSFAIGAVSGVHKDGEFLAADIIVYDAKAIESIQNGKQELSCGYFCDLEEAPGSYVNADGATLSYDAIQRAIKGNHVAIVDKGRAGPKARIYMDAADAEMVDLPLTTGAVMTKINLDGVELEVSDEVNSAVTKLVAGNDALKARLDTVEVELSSFKDEKAKQEALKAREELLARVATIANVKADGLSDREIMVAAIKEISPDFSDAGRSDEYIVARLDATIEFANKRNLISEEASKVVKSDAVERIVDYKQKLIEQLSAQK